MKDLLKDISPVTVGNHDFVKLDVNTFIQIPPIPTNRDSARRVPKMKSIFDDAYIANQESTLTEVAVGIVKEDFLDTKSNTVYLKGDCYIVDGNTRANYWAKYSDRAAALKNGITAKIHYLTSMEDVNYAYYPYNSSKSTEKASEILQGLARRYNWTPRQNVFANGGYKSAIDWASYTPGEDTKDVFGAFETCFDGLKILDSIPRDGKYTITKPYLDGLKSQAIIAALLTVLRYRRNDVRLYEMVERLATITNEELSNAMAHGEIDCVQIIAIEYTNRSCQRNKNADAEPWLHGLARSTKFESKRVQMDFLIHWILRYLENPKATWNFNKGVKPEYWQGAWEEVFPAELEE